MQLVPLWGARAPQGVIQGDRTILTRLSFLSHSVCYAAPTKTPHERRIAQTRALGPCWVPTPARRADGQALQRRAGARVPGAGPAALTAALPVLDPGTSMIRMVRPPWGDPVHAILHAASACRVLF